MITADVISQALHSIREAEPLGDCPLLKLSALRARARRDGPNSPTCRAALLSEYLDEIVWGRLAELRGTGTVPRRERLTPRGELESGARDFRAGIPELEAWSVLYLRHLGSSRVSLVALADRLGASRRTLSRRTAIGYELLARALREREVRETPASRHIAPADAIHRAGGGNRAVA